MIQLTKGTNVLDINLSDFSGAGQDVVQNGSFDDIGSDLVQNGDFAEIGSDLVTNGDFSDVPLGSELVTDGSFPLPNVNWTVGSSWTITGTSVNKTSDNSDLSQIIPSLISGKQYRVTLDVTFTSGSLSIRVGNSSPQTITSSGTKELTFTSGDNTKLLFYSSFVGSITNVSVKEVINLVSNPNFTDGVEKIVDGDFPLPNVNWTLNSGWTIPVGGSADWATLGSNNPITQSLTFATDKSYKVTFTIANVVGTPVRILIRNQGDVNQDITASWEDFDDGTFTYYFVSSSNNTSINIYGRDDVGDSFSLSNVSVKELGADWTLGTGWSIGDSEAVSDGTNSQITQSVMTAEKSYKITVTVTGDPYRLVFTGSSFYNSLAERTLLNGTHTYYLQAESSVFSITNTGEGGDACTLSNISVQELGEGWTLFSDVSVGENKLICDNVAENTSIASQSGIVPTQKSVKVTYDVVVDSGAFRLLLGSGGTTSEVTTSGTYVFYETSGLYGTLTLQARGGGFDGSVTNITVQEVGQDWTVQEPAGQSVTFPNSTLSIVYDSTQTQGSTGVYQDVLTIGKYYKFEIDIASITGNLKLQVGSDSQVISTTGTSYFYTESDSARIYIVRNNNVESVSAVVNSISVKQLDTNGRWVTFADPDSKSVMKLGQVDLEIDASGNNCGVYQTGLIKPNKLYIITINMKATAALNVEIAASLGTAVSAVIGTTALTTSYVEYSFEYVTPFAVDHDLQIHRLSGSGDSETISIDYVSMNGVDESKWINDPTWNPFATSLVYVPTLTDESTNNSKQFTLDTSIADGGWDGRSLHGQVIINESPTEDPANGEINLEQPNFLEGFYQVEIRGYLGTFYRILGKGMAHLERASTEDGYNRFEAYNDSVTYKAYEE
jgi:hypothetical protein